MPDGWNYNAAPDAVSTIRQPWTLKEKAEREYPGHTYIRADDILTGLWRDVTLMTPNGQVVTRRLFF